MDDKERDVFMAKITYLELENDLLRARLEYLEGSCESYDVECSFYELNIDESDCDFSNILN